jgi:polygalacturonase
MNKGIGCFILMSWIYPASVLAAGPVFNVKDYGAAGDGTRLETASINKAIDECTASGGGTVLVPAGRYLTGTIILKSHVNLSLDSGATLLGSSNPADYPSVDDPWDPIRKQLAPLIWSQDQNDISVTGHGTIDGQGEPWWLPVYGARNRGIPSRPGQAPVTQGVTAPNGGRPQLVRLLRCKDVTLQGIHLMYSPSWNIHPVFCEHVRVDGISIFAPVPSPNTDGINPEGCKDVHISNCRIDVGDDCVTLKSGINEVGRKMNMPDEDITITNCVMYQGHGGVTIGSEMSGGVRNVTVSNCVFHGTDIGIRVKSQRGRGGVVEGLTVSNIVMQDVPHPFTITTFYMGTDRPEDNFPVNEGTPTFRDFLFTNITARGAKDAGSITGLKEKAVEQMMFMNVHIQSETGFNCTAAKQVSFKDVVIDTKSGPALRIRGSDQIDTSGITTRMPHDGTPLIETVAPTAAGNG